MIKLIRAFLVTASICALISNSLVAQAAESSINTENTEINEIPDFVQYVIDDEDMGEIITTHEMYDSNNEISAYCLDFNNAYMIYDKYGNIVEYSECNVSPLDGINDTVYYTGPFEYYTIKDEELCNVISEETITFEQLDIESAEFNEIAETTYANENSVETFSINNSNYSTTSTSDLRKVKTALKNKPRTLNYNTSDRCGCLAAVIMLCYYYDYINTSYLNSSYANNPQSLFNYLNNYISGYASYLNIIDGINNASPYIASAKPSMTYCINSDGDQIWGQYSYLVSSQKISSILLLVQHPSYGGAIGNNHWVVTYGVVMYYDDSNTLVKKMFVVNNGYGKNDIKISAKYGGLLIWFN